MTRSEGSSIWVLRANRLRYRRLSALGADQQIPFRFLRVGPSPAKFQVKFPSIRKRFSMILCVEVTQSHVK